MASAKVWRRRGESKICCEKPKCGMSAAEHTRKDVREEGGTEAGPDHLEVKARP